MEMSAYLAEKSKQSGSSAILKGTFPSRTRERAPPTSNILQS